MTSVRPSVRLYVRLVTGESRSFAMSTAGPAAAAAQRLVYTGEQSLTGRARGVTVEFH